MINLLIVSGIVSLAVQWLKQFGSGGYQSQLLLIGASLVGGVVIWFFQGHQNYLLVVGQIVRGANAIYSFVLSYLEPKSAGPGM